jgi:hypothetical protein
MKNQEIRPVRFMVANGFSELRPPTVYGDVSPMAAFDGEPINDTEFPFTEEIMLEFSNADGKARRTKRRTARSDKKQGRATAKKTRQGDRSSARKQRAEIRDRKMTLKEKEQATQAEVAKKIGEQSPEEIALMNQIASQGETKSTLPPQKGMSKNLKIGLVVGSVLVIGIVVFAIVKSRKKSKK